MAKDREWKTLDELCQENIEYKTDKWQRVRNGKLWMKYVR